VAFHDDNNTHWDLVEKLNFLDVPDNYEYPYDYELSFVGLHVNGKQEFVLSDTTFDYFKNYTQEYSDIVRKVLEKNPQYKIDISRHF
jgi:hypothetical protein